MIHTKSRRFMKLRDYPKNSIGVSKNDVISFWKKLQKDLLNFFIKKMAVGVILPPFKTYYGEPLQMQGIQKGVSTFRNLARLTPVNTGNILQLLILYGLTPANAGNTECFRRISH